MNKVSSLAAAIILAAAPTLASAVNINFTDVSQLQNERSGSPYSAGPYNFLVAANGGITATARAGYWDGSGNLAGDYAVNSAGYQGSTVNTTNYPFPRLYSWSGGGGLGVYNVTNSEEHTVDNKNGYFDFVQFAFDVPVTISAVTVSCVGCDVDPNDGDAAYRVGTGPAGSWTEQAWDGTATFTLPGGLFVDPSEFFYFGASRIIDQVCTRYYAGTNICKPGRLENRYDDFKIQSLTVDFTPPERIPPEEVPEPATLASLAIGALAMAAGRRRRRR